MAPVVAGSRILVVVVAVVIVLATSAPICQGLELGKEDRPRRQAEGEGTDGPIMSFKSFNVTASEAERHELPASIGSYDFASFEHDEIVDKHNQLRRKPAARNDFEREDPNALTSSDMEYISWDDDLAYMGFLWARQCEFRHDQPENVSPYETIGQNLWAHTGSEAVPLSGSDATQDWYDEVTMYTYQAGSGGYCSGVCGHYTQIVWAPTNRVGCGRYFCPYLSYAGLRNAWNVVCNYAPAGNYYGKQPYALGPPCSECLSGSGQCYNDLCRPCSEHSEQCECRQSCENCGVLNQDTCVCDCPTGSGYYGSGCKKQCIETSNRCLYTWWPQFCPDYPDVREGCPQMCGLCTAADPNFVCRPQVNTPAPPFPPNPSEPRPAMCDMKFTAAGYIDGELHLFQDNKMWRVDSNGRLLSPEVGDIAADTFLSLPSKVSAVYQIASTGEVVFVRGKKAFTYLDGRRTDRVTLSSMGIPKAPTGAIRLPWETQTFFFKGSKVYALDETAQPPQLATGYPRAISNEYPGVPDKLNAAFSDASGNQYFVRSKKVFKISYRQTSIDAGYPKFLTEAFINRCTE